MIKKISRPGAYALGLFLFICSCSEASALNTSQRAGIYDYFRSKVAVTSTPQTYGGSSSSVLLQNNYSSGDIVGGSDTYGVDMMKMIALADPTTSDARRYKEMLTLYVMASEGELCTATNTLEPQVYAAMHRNETSGATFLDKTYELDSNHTLTKFSKEHRGGSSYGTTGVGVFKDANSDGMEDGPFQIEAGASVSSERKSILNPAGSNSSRAFSTWFFPDSLSWVNHDFSAVVKTYDLNQYDDTRAVSMLAAAKHNRGSFNRQVWGLNYYTQTPSFSSITNASNSDTITEMMNVVNGLTDTFDTLRPTITETSNTAMRSVGIYLALQDGWYITKDGVRTQSVFTNIPALAEELVPGYSGTLYDAIIDTYSKNPWDVIGITAEQYKKIYGVSNYMSSYNQTHLFKVEDYTSDLYVNKMPDGSDPPVVHVFDEIVIGHMVGSGIMGDYIFLELLIKAGFPTEYMGVVVDKSNPQTMYDLFKSNNSNSYNPQYTSNDGNFDELISLLGINTTPERLLSLSHVYEQLGTKYLLGGHSLQVNAANYSTHKDSVLNLGSAATTTYLNSTLYGMRDGSAYVHGTSVENDILWYGKRLFDCSTLALAGPSLGRTQPNGKLYYSSGTSSIVNAAGKSEIYNMNGVNYDTGWYLAYDKRIPLSNYKTNSAQYVEGGLQPGDIMTCDGHTLTVLCIAPKSVVIPASIAKSATDVNVEAGTLITLEAWSTGQYNCVRAKGWGDSRSYNVIRLNFFD